jgi:hypothetical protein
VTVDEAARVRLLVEGLRVIARSAGPSHTYSDVIADGEALLRGELAMLWGDDFAGWCAQAELLVKAAALRMSRP